MTLLCDFINFNSRLENKDFNNGCNSKFNFSVPSISILAFDCTIWSFLGHF